MLVEMSFAISKKTIAVFAVDAQGADSYFVDDAAFARWCMHDLELPMIAAVKPIVLRAKAPGQLELSRALRRLKQEWRHIHGGVFVLPPTDFLTTSSSIAFAVGDAGKPIICATQLLAVPYSTNAFFSHVALRAHIMNAVQAATVDMSGTVLIGGSEIIPVTHAGLRSDGRLYAVDRHHYGHIDFGIRPSEHAGLFREQPLQLQLSEAPIAHVDASSADFQQTLKQRVAGSVGVVLLSANAADRRIADQVLSKSLSVLVVGQDGTFLREKGKWVTVKRLTPQTAAAKFVWVLGQRKTNPAYKRVSIADAMKRDVIGEILV
jgi:hypothetical protein